MNTSESPLDRLEDTLCTTVERYGESAKLFVPPSSVLSNTTTCLAVDAPVALLIVEASRVSVMAAVSVPANATVPAKMEKTTIAVRTTAPIS
jgi:hypothetical protein